MGAPERIVRHLRLRADSEASVRRAALKLEDALRCASLPDAGSRLLLVRRLDLGRISPGVSPQTLSMLLEERVAAIGGTWVHGASPDSESADFVFFRDALEARIELALRLARVATCVAWFWPLAVPEFRSYGSVATNLRNIAFSIAALPEAPAALPAWIASLSAGGVASVLARAITAAEGATLLSAAHQPVRARASKDVRTAQRKLQRPGPATLTFDNAESSRYRQLAPAFAALPMWLQTLAIAGGVLPRVLFDVSADYAAPAKDVAPDKKGVAPGRAKFRNTETGLEVAERGDYLNVGGGTPLADRPISNIVSAPGLPDDMRKETQSDLSPDKWSFPDAVPSAYGGLLFLLPVLHRMGYASWADTLPERAGACIVQQVLASVLQRSQAPSDDPAWLLASKPLRHDFGDIECQAPASWGDPSLAAPRGSLYIDIVALAAQARSTDAFAHVWLIACRRWLRRVAGIGVASLVRRASAIGLTETHADIYFRLMDVDIRVRRVGLDCDLGWVPWLGRIVNFHYRDYCV